MDPQLLFRFLRLTCLAIGLPQTKVCLLQPRIDLNGLLVVRDCFHIIALFSVQNSKFQVRRRKLAVQLNCTRQQRFRLRNCRVIRVLA